MDVATLTPDLLDDIIVTVSTARPHGKPEKRWTQRQIERAGEAVAERYTIAGFDEWNASCLRDREAWVRVDLDFAMTVDRHLPKQPWKPGIHRMVAQQLGCSATRCSEAIEFLIGQGLRNRQRDGIVYDTEGNVVDYDRERVKNGSLEFEALGSSGPSVSSRK